MDQEVDLPTGSGRVLVVDDNPDVRTTVRLMLEVLGYAVTEAGDGPSALARLRGGELPDVVVLDLLMPGMPGEQVLEKIRELDAGLPVVVLTGNDRESVRGLGVTDFLQKPFTVADVGWCLKRALHRRRGQ